MRRLASMIAALSLVAAGFVGVGQTANANPAGALAFTCTASLPSWPSPAGTGGTCSGTAIGAITGVFAGAASLDVSNINYNELCVLNEAVAGFASGDIKITGSGTLSDGFTWTRVGATAVITLNNGGAATAVFAPTAPVPPPACDNPQPLTALVVGDAATA